MTKERDTAPEEPGTEMLGLLGGFMISQAVFAVARLGVADHLLDGPRPVTGLAETVGARPDLLRRLLRILSAHRVFLLDEATDEAALGPLGRSLASGTPGSLRNMALNWNDAHYVPFSDLHKTVQDGRTVYEHHHGVPFFERLGQEPERNARFSRSMRENLHALRMSALRCIDVTGVTTVVDLGGADGTLLADLVTRHRTCAAPCSTCPRSRTPPRRDWRPPVSPTA